MVEIRTTRRAFLLAAAAAAVAPRTAFAGTGSSDAAIVRAAIHPAIGIARVGDSAEFFIGPEVTQPAAMPAGACRDGRGALKRQAARFRIFGSDAAGNVVREITADDPAAEVAWTVHVANTKAGWYRFVAALDLPEAAGLSVPRRNAGVANRAALAIDPGPRTIPGRPGAAAVFDSGNFRGVRVPLGSIETDAAGRLVVLGGRGRAGSPSDAPLYNGADPDSFNNADNWWDDIADGPVTATLTLGGRRIPVEGAWVAVAPPNYAPDILGWRTLHELLVDTYVEAGWMDAPATVSFATDVLPVLRRLTSLQWVNAGFAALFGAGAPLHFADPRLIAKLAAVPTGGDDPFGELRQVVFNAFRPANARFNEPRLWPWLYGDAFDSFPGDPAANSLALSSVRQALLRRWVDGDFVNDWDPAAIPPRTLDEVPLADRPQMLDEAALTYCLADAFHPGCELTWPMRHVSLYARPFRIRQRPAGEAEPDYGPRLTAAAALAPGGPLGAQGPGGLTRWMAVPWQGDTAFCRSGYDESYDPYLPTFWPARVPNQVLTEADYAVVMDLARPRAERIAAFHRRAHWLRAVSTGSVEAVMRRMVERFAALGIVEARPGPAGDPDFPSVIYVETFAASALKTAGSIAERLGRTTADPAATRLAKAGWESAEQRDAFRRAKSRQRP